MDNNPYVCEINKDTNFGQRPDLLKRQLLLQQQKQTE